MPSARHAVPISPHRKKVGFAGNLAVLRWIFPVLSLLLPGVCARLALNFFLTPPKHKEPLWETAHIKNARRERLVLAGKYVAVYAWGEGEKRVLLCHAWGGRGAQLAAFVEPLLARGYTVIAFDAPAHGRSSGKHTDIMEYSNAVDKIIVHVGGVHAIVGHSFGAANAIFAKHRFGFHAEKLALIGCFSHGSWAIDQFGELLNIPAKIIKKMAGTLEDRHDHRLEWKKLDIVEMAKSETTPILVVHDRKDSEIPFSHAQEFHAKCGDKIATFTTDGLGHRRILRDAAVVARVCEFVDG